MNLIVNVDEQWGIGKDGDLLIHIPEDMKFVREKTQGNIIVMGRKTLETFPNKRPLKNRTNVVLTRDKTYACEGALIFHDKESLLEYLQEQNKEDIFVFGGGTIYEMLLPYCEKAYVTKTFSNYNADTQMVNLDEKPEWNLVKSSEIKEHDGVQFQFCEYTVGE